MPELPPHQAVSNLQPADNLSIWAIADFQENAGDSRAVSPTGKDTREHLPPCCNVWA